MKPVEKIARDDLVRLLNRCIFGQEVSYIRKIESGIECDIAFYVWDSLDRKESEEDIVCLGRKKTMDWENEYPRIKKFFKVKLDDFLNYRISYIQYTRSELLAYKELAKSLREEL